MIRPRVRCADPFHRTQRDRPGQAVEDVGHQGLGEIPVFFREVSTKGKWKEGGRANQEGFVASRTVASCVETAYMMSQKIWQGKKGEKRGSVRLRIPLHARTKTYPVDRPPHVLCDVGDVVGSGEVPRKRTSTSEGQAKAERDSTMRAMTTEMRAGRAIPAGRGSAASV
jgi:hypothetical protein